MRKVRVRSYSYFNKFGKLVEVPEHFRRVWRRVSSKASERTKNVRKSAQRRLRVLNNELAVRRAVHGVTSGYPMEYSMNRDTANYMLRLTIEMIQRAMRAAKIKSVRLRFHRDPGILLAASSFLIEVDDMKKAERLADRLNKLGRFNARPFVDEEGNVYVFVENMPPIEPYLTEWQDGIELRAY